ncbi:hypothetical protein BMETH_1390_0 [methanotrophic bacterial endosymbiont of Bathymodiolus sp.]|nr:hypothetical protein BMETH_1390_0 [methanotrophic bacterial endosymbiont of Bathymodiolus sp.]
MRLICSEPNTVVTAAEVLCSSITDATDPARNGSNTTYSANSTPAGVS